MSAVLLISSSIAIAVSFLCSLAEVLLFSLNPLMLNRMQAEQPRAARSWRRLKKNVARPITAILVLNTVAHTGGATVAGGAFAELYGERNIWIFSVVFTVLVLFGTEILPKVLGVAFRSRLAPAAGPLLELLTRAMSPFIWLSEAMFRRLAEKGESAEQVTTADLVTLAALARSGKAINLEQENIIVNTVRLSHTPVGRVMIRPGDIQFIRQGDGPDEVLDRVRKTGHTRYPVSRTSDPGDIFGYVVAKKVLFGTEKDRQRLLADAVPIQQVKERETLMAALRLMLQKKEHLLAVSGAGGRCVGIVTLEDIAGELLSADIETFR